jgi:DNA-binding transcriptional regulator YiaG
MVKLEIPIRELREARALSQEALARLVGVSVRTVARWESGISQPSPLALEKLQQTIWQGNAGVATHEYGS